MNGSNAGRVYALVCLLVAAAVMAGCGSDDNVVYGDFPGYNPPPDEAHGFLGYLEPETQLTTCGGCHAGAQTEWAQTAHATALESLEMSGHAASYCYGCHTVSQSGNPLDEAGGYNVVETPVYHDVQCESCHGAGLTHVEDPTGSQPLAALSIGAAFDEGCAECHSGTHHPFAEEWSQSAHANMDDYPAGRPECGSCHRGQGVLEAWGVTANYAEKDAAEHMQVTCGVCHDPHATNYEGQLRFPIDTNSPELHLCARCHDRRSEPDGSSHGLHPHSPETALLVGSAGWYPPGSVLVPGTLVASHGSEGNATLCAACHVASYDINDSATGEFLFHSTGHLFTALPCVDANGIPQSGSCGYTPAERSFVGCAVAGCHLSEQAASSALTAATSRMETWTSDLLSLLEQVDANLDAPGGEIDADVATFTVAEGAYFNYALATHGDGVHGATTHNPFLMEALLLASITAVEDEYNVTARPYDHRRELRELIDQKSR